MNKGVMVLKGKQRAQRPHIDQDRPKTCDPSSVWDPRSKLKKIWEQIQKI